MGNLTRARATAAAVLAAWAALGACRWGTGRARAAEAPSPEPAEGPELSAREVASVKDVLRRLADAITEGDASALDDLLSPTLSADERKRTVSRARGEFDRFSYLRFEFDLAGELPIDRLGSDEIEIVSVPAAYEYEARTPSADQMASKTENCFRFRCRETDGEWRIVRSDLFDQFTPLRVEPVLGLVFVGGFVGVLALFLWGWMALDAWMRFGRARYALLVLLSTPLGAGVYFFVVYLRRKFLPREEA